MGDGFGNKSRFQSSNLCYSEEWYHGTLTYYWEFFQPVLFDSLQSLAQPYFETSLINALGHLEICHSDRCHNDTVVMSDHLYYLLSDRSRPVLPPSLDNTVTHVDLTESQNYFHSFILTIRFLLS